MMQNSVAIAAISPDVFAYLYKRTWIHTFGRRGNSHCKMCTSRDNVSSDLRVPRTISSTSRKEKTYFLTPQTHILIRHGTQIACNSFAPTMYLLGNAWYKMMPKHVETVPPTIIKILQNCHGNMSI